MVYQFSDTNYLIFRHFTIRHILLIFQALLYTFVARINNMLNICQCSYFPSGIIYSPNILKRKENEKYFVWKYVCQKYSYRSFILQISSEGNKMKNILGENVCQKYFYRSFILQISSKEKRMKNIFAWKYVCQKYLYSEC